MSLPAPVLSPASPRRDVLNPWPRRLVVFDTCVLTSDIIAALNRGRPSSLLASMRFGTVHGYITHRVWAEAPRVLEDRAREGGQFDLQAAWDLWWSAYVPVLYVVDVGASAADEPPVRKLRQRDASDAETLALQIVLAPAALLSTDSDLLDSGLVYPDWVQARSALGKLGLAEQDAREQAETAELMVTLPIRGGAAAVTQAWRFAQVHPVLAVLSAAALFEAARRFQRAHPAVFEQKVKPVLVAIAEKMAEDFGHAVDRHKAGETVWLKAELGQAGEPMIYRVARLLACRGPMTRTAILKALGACRLSANGRRWPTCCGCCKPRQCSSRSPGAAGRSAVATFRSDSRAQVERRAARASGEARPSSGNCW